MNQKNRKSLESSITKIGIGLGLSQIITIFTPDEIDPVIEYGATIVLTTYVCLKLIQYSVNNYEQKYHSS